MNWIDQRIERDKRRELCKLANERASQFIELLQVDRMGTWGITNWSVAAAWLKEYLGDYSNVVRSFHNAHAALLTHFSIENDGIPVYDTTLMSIEEAYRIGLLCALLHESCFDGSTAGLRPMPWSESDKDPTNRRRAIEMISYAAPLEHMQNWLKLLDAALHRLVCRDSYSARANATANEDDNLGGRTAESHSRKPFEERGHALTDSTKNTVSNVKGREASGDFSDNAWFTHIDIAVHHKVDREALRKRLDRYRNKDHNAWREVEIRAGNEPKYLYRYGSVKGIAEDLRASSESSSEPSGERPTK